MAEASKTLQLVIDAQTAAARDAIKALADISDASADKVEAAFKRIEDALEHSSTKTGVIAGLVGGATEFIAEKVEQLGERFLEAAENALEYAGTLRQVAEKAGVSTDFLQTYRYATQQNEITTASADEALKQFNRSIGLAAEGNLRASTAFKGLNVDIHNSDGTLKTVAQAFPEVAEAISKISSPAEQAARAQQLMKETGLEMLPVLRQGAAGFDEYAAAAHRLGLILTPEQIANAAEAEQKFRDIKNVLNIEFASAITANADALLQLASAFSAVVGGMAQFAAHFPQVTKLLAGGVAGAALGGTVGTTFGGIGAVPGAMVGGTVGLFGGAFGDQVAGAAALYHKAGGGLDGIREFLNASRDDDLAAYEGSKPKPKPEKEVKPTLPVDDRAQGVLARLQGEANAGGDKRQEAIARALNEAGVTGDSATGQSIAALAGQVYDQGPGKAAAEAAARKAAEEKKKAAEQAAAADRDVVTAHRAFDAAETEAADTPEARYDLASSKVDDKYSDALTTIAGKQATGKLSKAQADDERWMAAMVMADEQIVLDRNEQARLVAEQLTTLETDIGVQKDELNARLAISDTAGERRKIQLKLLDLETQEARAAQQAVINNPKSTTAQIADAKTKLAGIDATAADKRTAVNRSTEDPLQAYARSVNLTTDQINEAFKGVEVDGLKGLEDGLAGVITGTESVGAAFTKMAQSIIGDLARILIEKEIVGPLAKVLTGTSASDAGGLIGAIFGGGFADGGVPPAGKVSLVGENGPELIVGNGTARVVPFAPASPRAATMGASGGGTMITVDARGASDPAEIDRRVRAGIIAVVPALHAGIRDSTIATLKRPMLPGGRS